ncbi:MULTISPECIES: HAAS signaling domain-containing protein [Bacillaceae]|uniref:HAAS signaling domain-containing protein n=1 Tax=Bacillaceae TaxID=186817 RepID=UPI0006710DA3|nr:DUF1700 domain-containing protein [Bacillus sp. FJAT-27916]
MLNKEAFMKELAEQLRGLPPNEQAEILADYAEYFDLGLLEGKTEQEIALGLGSPKTIAKELVLNSSIEKTEHNLSMTNVLRIIGLTIGLGFLNFLLIVGPMIAIVSILFAGWIASITMIAAPIIQLAEILFDFNHFSLFEVFVSIGACGLGLLLFIGMYHLSKLSMRLTIRYCKWNMNIVKGRESYV